MNSPAEVAKNYISIGKAKTTNSIGKLLILGILAGAFIAFAGVGATTAAVSIEKASVAKFVGACVFPAGLAMVLIAGSELFTGNCLIIIPVLDGEVTVGAMLRNWVIVYIGNLIGGMLIAFLATYSNTFALFGNGLAVSATSTAVAKVSMTFGSAFLKGVLCNILVCIAVWMAFAAKDVTGKIIGLFFPIMLFVLCGYEHSVADMYYVPAGLFAKMKFADAVADVSNLNNLNWGTFFIKNLIPVTLGNIVGGAFLVGLPYWAVYLRKSKTQKETEKTVNLSGK